MMLAALLVFIGVSVAVATSNTRKRHDASSNEDDLSKVFRRPPLPPELIKAPDYVPPPTLPEPMPAASQAAPVASAAGVDPEPQRELIRLPIASPGVSGSADRGPYSAAALEHKRLEEHWQARRSGLFVEVRDTSPDDSDAHRAHGAPSVLAPSSELGVPSEPMPNSAPGLGELGELDPNLQAHKESFLQRGTKGDGYLRARLQRPRSPYEVKAGTIIPAVLQTGINSDLPGPVFARVREDVYDTVTGDYLLIPQNSTLVAAYDSRVAWGQERVLMCWQRLILPNGSSVNLDCMPAADLAGAAGLTDEVDEHWWRIVKGATVASLLSAATTAAAGSTTGFQPTIPQQFARGAASEIGRAGENITRRNLMIQPTITIRPGWSLNVMVVQDLILEPYADD